MSVLRLGANGVEVARLQTLLVQHGQAVKIDGDFGPLTETALRAFQTAEHALHANIAVDGVAGTMTWALLEQRAVQPLEAEDPTANGLLIDGGIYPVPGFKVVGPHDAAWSHLSPGDCRTRRLALDGTWLDVRQWIVHKTLADDPESVIPGKGPTGGARRTAEYWQGDPTYGGAHIVFGDDGEIACLADLRRVEAFHATASNRWSVGSETRELPGGRFYEAALRATVAGIVVGAPKLGIQMQSHRGPYTGHPLRRMADGAGDPSPGGPDMVGIFGHRDNTERRGKWDPGEIVWAELRAAVPGFELFDFDKREDIECWTDRQRDLQRAGHTIKLTGIADRATVGALKLEGYRDGIWALGKA